MTESEWDACTDPDAMLSLLTTRGHASERKLRLHLAVLCRLLRHKIRDERSREAFRAAEKFADGLIGRQQLTEASRRAHHVLMEETLRRSAASTIQAVWLACAVAGNADNLLVTRVPLDRRLRVSLIREVFGGGPLRPATIGAGVVGNAAVRLAQAAYEERDALTGQLDNQRLGVLADALEEAGCTDALSLSHLRGPGPHVRGCHVVDAVLSKG